MLKVKMKGNTIMKALRYLLMAIATLGVLSVSAQTHQYVTTHYSSHEQTISAGVHVNPQMPTATMGYMHSDYMTTGSTLPQAAIDGVTTTEEQESPSRHGHIRRVGDDDEFEDEGDPTKPADPFPIGDAAIPLALLACAYLIIRVRRAKGGRTA